MSASTACSACGAPRLGRDEELAPCSYCGARAASSVPSHPALDLAHVAPSFLRTWRVVVLAIGAGGVAIVVAGLGSVGDAAGSVPFVVGALFLVAWIAILVFMLRVGRIPTKRPPSDDAPGPTLS